MMAARTGTPRSAILEPADAESVGYATLFVGDGEERSVIMPGGIDLQ